MSEANPSRIDPCLQVQAWLRALPELTPREMFDELGRIGYIGQVAARRALCLSAFRHMRRIRRLHVDRVPRDRLPRKENVLLMGPTGCGKTFLVESLFRKILSLPFVTIDTTSLTETGYIGNDASSAAARLVESAGEIPMLAGLGVICLDEFDKLATTCSSAVFAGAGTTKDVSGAGVQKELLGMLDGADVVLSPENARWGARLPSSLQTLDVPIIACGAFSAFHSAIQGHYSGSLTGFSAPSQSHTCPNWSIAPSANEIEATASFERYGFMPELIGRFARTVALESLHRDSLKQILIRGCVKGYQHELGLEGISLEISDAVFEHIVGECLAKGTGARGLHAILSGHLEETCFDVYSDPASQGRTIRLNLTDAQVVGEVS